MSLKNSNLIRLISISLLLAFAVFSVSESAFAGPGETGDKCFDGKDNDRDGLIDADDPDCAGAPPPGPSLEDQVAELQALVATLQAELQANTAADAAAHHAKYTDAEANSAVGPHSPDFSLIFSGVTRMIDPNSGYDTLRFTDMNLQIVNGRGIDDGANGTGNLIIGYNELRDENQAAISCPSDAETEFFCNRRTGSHMLVVGRQNNYTSYGGIVVGYGNEVANRYSAVSGGWINSATGEFSAISGGKGHLAVGAGSSITGGWYNIVTGAHASISGGSDNIASFDAASISGGYENEASGRWASISGGRGHVAQGVGSAITGGWYNTTTGAHASISGGADNIASFDAASVSGGRYNEASGLVSSISGGKNKIASTEGCVVGDDGIDC